jgi:alkylated DNA repair dioxygenase AlkB
VLLQGSLLDLEPPHVDADALSGRLERINLGSGAWVDLCHAWLAGTYPLFEELERVVPWRAERRPMYERVVDVPRLMCFYGAGDALPSPRLGEARDVLNAYYDPQQEDPLVTAGLCLYRDGRDSVAWHGDRIGRGRRSDIRIAIVSLGATRNLLLRPRGGGHARRFTLSSGDLLVMGGTCQRTFEHAVPKTARPVGPRMSVQFRPRGVR